MEKEELRCIILYLVLKEVGRDINLEQIKKIRRNALNYCFKMVLMLIWGMYKIIPLCMYQCLLMV